MAAAGGGDAAGISGDAGASGLSGDSDSGKFKALAIKNEAPAEDVKPDLRSVCDTYEVEKIVGIKVTETGEKLYKVRWKGFSESDDTWEPYENLTDGCDRLILEYESKTRAKDDEPNGEVPSTSRSNEHSENSSERSGSRHTHTGHWRYETVEILTPDEWNRFGDFENRELGGLYIPDRIPTETEKILCNLPPDLGRVTRTKLRTVMKTEISPSKEVSPVSSGKKGASARSKGRGKTTDTENTSGEGARRSEIKQESDALASSIASQEENEAFSPPKFTGTAIITKAELPDEALLPTFSDSIIQNETSDALTEDGEERLSTNNSAGRRGRGRGGGRGRGRPKRTSLPVSNRRTASSANDDEEQTVPANEGVSSNMVVDEQQQMQGTNLIENDAVVSGTKRPSSFISGRGRVQGQKAAKIANRIRRATAVEKTVKISKVRDSSRQPTKNRKRRASASKSADDQIKESSSTNIEDGRNNASESSKIDQLDISALEMFACETPELPIPLTNAPISAIEIAAIRKHQQNREKPLQTFEQFRSAVLSNRLSAVKWTGRCVPERRGFDFNQKYRGKTVAIELCERPCNPAHETDDMLRQIVRDGARLDIPDDTRGRIPLHFAIACEFWCRARTLLHLRSPVNTEDKDKKTPLQLAITTRNPSMEATQIIHLLLEYGADINKLIRRVDNDYLNRYASNLVRHQQHLSAAFDEARMKTLVDMTVKRILLPPTVRAFWELESTDWTTEIGFEHETFQFPNNRYAYIILLGVFDFRSTRCWRIRLWGDSPFVDVQMNDEPVESLTYNPKGFVYVSTLINGWNKLKIKVQPIKVKKWLLIAQVLLVQLHKPAPAVQRPALEVAPESGTDWRHD